MKIQEVRAIAKKWGVSTRPGRTKKDIIRDIQVKEGYEPCFATRTRCEEYNCLWRDDCLSAVSHK
ncbi:MAG: SAP domain-containing protein [Deltaproteobacteria bacterium]|nr:SAP domain-containing protein [Deltaproteobacteria bacterium]